jgi:hypothetical protein
MWNYVPVIRALLDFIWRHNFVLFIKLDYGKNKQDKEKKIFWFDFVPQTRTQRLLCAGNGAEFG